MRVLAPVFMLLALQGTARADRAAALREADRMLADGSSDAAERAAVRLLGDRTLTPAERAQAHRIRGLALFYLERRTEAEAEMRAYLRLDPDAHLDPALVPPEAVVFFEGVRTRNAGELRTIRPRPKRKRYPVLNLLPPIGQVQNGDTTKAWVIAGAGAALLAGNITTYAMLRSSCEPDLTCDRDPSASRRLRVVNLGTGAALVGLWAYGVIDGVVGYRRERPTRLTIAPIGDGALVHLGSSF